MTEFVVSDASGTRIAEGHPGIAMLTATRDVNELVEVCLGGRARAALLYAENLPAAFFDLSSRVAGEILQKLQTYGGIRLAVIAKPGAVRLSTRFNEMAEEARWKGHFAMFEDESTARAWLLEGSSD